MYKMVIIIEHFHPFARNGWQKRSNAKKCKRKISLKFRLTPTLKQRIAFKLRKD